MPAIVYHPVPDDAVIAAGLDAIRLELHITESFDADAQLEADTAAREGPRLPPGVPEDRAWPDRRDLELIAIDPAGSRDLDQAYTAERRGDGYRVWYAIADVASFVAPGGALEAASLDRGVTLYAPDRRASLHPAVLNEGAASLLPGADRPSCLWRIDLDAEGRLLESEISRAMVRVREAVSYRDAQDEIDGDAPPRSGLELLAEIGTLRLQRERERGAISLNLPSQEITRRDGGYALAYDKTLPVESWNAQISLLTGMAAARTMLDAGIGILRTLPAADPDTITQLRHTARALHVDWPPEEGYAERIRRLDPSDPSQAALLVRSARVLRGAGYVAFTDAGEIPDNAEHAAIASTYAHVTAPLRRVCDRYANEILLALCGGYEPPDWARTALVDLPSVMGRARSHERALERAVVDYMEAMLLSGHIGETFEAVVVNHRRIDDETVAVIQLASPAVIASLNPPPDLGARVRVKLLAVDPIMRRVDFTLA